MHRGGGTGEMRVDVAEAMPERPAQARVNAVIVEHADQVAIEGECPRYENDSPDGEARPPGRVG
jgi:hypothetical protein